MIDNKQKKYESLVGIIVIIAMLFSIFTFSEPVLAETTWNWGDAGHYDISWYNRTDTEFEINTPEKLAGLAYIVNQGKELKLDGEETAKQETFLGKTIKLTADIELNEDTATGQNSTMHQWPSIAGGDNTNNNGASFNGTFDGDGHTVSNIYIYDNTPYSQTYYSNRNRALFGVTAENTTIKNVAVSGYIFGARGIGGIVGKTGTVVTNQYNENLSGHGTMIINCINKCTVTGGESKGIGGIVGSAWNHPVIVGCKNEGNITAKAFSDKATIPVGGIAGESEGSIDSCQNTGSVKGCGGNTGGIVGSSKLSYAQIINCINSGEVINDKYGSQSCAGGIAGYQAGATSNCYNVGTIRFTEDDGTSESVIGSIFGELKSNQDNDNIYCLDISCMQAIGKDSSAVKDRAVIKTETDESMKTKSFVTDLNGSGRAFSYSEGEYPILALVQGTITGIKIKTLPNQTVYLEGETMDTTGMVVEAQYLSQDDVTLSEGSYEIKGFDSTKETLKQLISVSYKGRTATFIVGIFSKESAIEELNNEVDINAYGEAEKQQVQDILDDATLEINNNVTSGKELQTVMNSTKNEIDKIDKIPSIKDTVISDVAEMTYTGKALEPAIKVETTLGEPLTEEKDYTVEYENNINAGTGKIIIKGVGNAYRDSLEKEFTIKKATQTITATNTIKKIYGNCPFNIKVLGKVGKLTYVSSNRSVATITSTGVVLIKGTGKVALTVKAAETSNYSQNIRRIILTVAPKRVSIGAVKRGNKSLKVRWKRDTKATGYKIYYSRYKSFKQAKAITIKSNRITTRTIKKLKTKKIYYIKVRAYKRSQGTIIYSRYSAVKKVKTK